MRYYIGYNFVASRNMDYDQFHLLVLHTKSDPSTIHACFFVRSSSDYNFPNILTQYSSFRNSLIADANGTITITVDPNLNEIDNLKFQLKQVYGTQFTVDIAEIPVARIK